ncbi:MAG: TonB-dependent receptor, partial [Ferruginibacter sp.]
MFRCILIGLVILFFQPQCFSQSPTQEAKAASIFGNVIDSVSKNPVEYATVTLLVEGNKKAVNGSLTDSLGRFVISNVKNGDYTIIIEFIGYDKRTIQHVNLDKKNPFARFNNIPLFKKQVTLQDVTVTSQRDLIENKIDKMVFNAEKDITSQGGVATDVLKKIPQVSVDVDGNVELAGSGGIRFLINGKPSSAFGSNIADVLQSIPASQIKSVEVITNPGARYDAQGLGGIINIILKQSKVKGINGTIAIGAGTRAENGSLNLNARKGNFGINAFASANVRLPADNSYSSVRLSGDAVNQNNILLQQNGSSRFKRHGQQAGIGFDWTLNKKNSITSSVTYDAFGNSSLGLVNQAQVIKDVPGSGNILSDIATITHSNSDFIFRTVDASLSYKKTFSQEDRELEISFNSSFGHNHVASNNNQVLLPQDSMFYGVNSTNNGKENVREVQLDYTQPVLKKIMLGMGGKVNYSEITSNANAVSFKPALNSYFYDKRLSNSLDYKQKVFALYS